MALNIKDRELQRRLRTWVRDILVEKQWHGTHLATLAGCSPSTILRPLNDPYHQFIFSLKTVNRIAKVAGKPLPQFMGSVEDASEVKVKKQRVDGVLVKRVSTLPEALRPMDDQDVVVPRLPQFEGDETAYAFYMPDNSLGPLCPSGCLLYATKRRDPRVGDLIVLTRREGQSLVKPVEDISENGIEMLNGPTIPFEDIEDFGIVAAMVRN